MNISLNYAVTIKLIPANLAKGVNLPKNVPKKAYHARAINTQRPLRNKKLA